MLTAQAGVLHTNIKLGIAAHACGPHTGKIRDRRVTRFTGLSNLINTASMSFQQMRWRLVLEGIS